MLIGKSRNGREKNKTATINECSIILRILEPPLSSGMLTRPEVDEADAEAEAKIALFFQPNFTF